MSKSTISNFFEMSATSLPALGVAKSLVTLSVNDAQEKSVKEVVAKPPKV